MEGSHSGFAFSQVDRSSYLVPLGEADIFFPTNFSILQHMYLTERNNASEEGTFTRVNSETVLLESVEPQATSRVWTSSDFMKSFSDFEQTRTRSGFNPLLEEYENMYFFTAGSR